MTEREEAIYTYRITPKSFCCYVIQPDLEFYVLAITDKIYYLSGNKGTREVTIDDYMVQKKFNKEALVKAQEWKEKYLDESKIR